MGTRSKPLSFAPIFGSGIGGARVKSPGAVPWRAGLPGSARPKSSGRTREGAVSGASVPGSVLAGAPSGSLREQNEQESGHWHGIYSLSVGAAGRWSLAEGSRAFPGLVKRARASVGREISSGPARAPA